MRPCRAKFPGSFARGLCLRWPTDRAEKIVSVNLLGGRSLSSVWNHQSVWFTYDKPTDVISLSFLSKLDYLWRWMNFNAPSMIRSKSRSSITSLPAFLRFQTECLRYWVRRVPTDSTRSVTCCHILLQISHTTVVVYTLPIPSSCIAQGFAMAWFVSWSCEKWLLVAKLSWWWTCSITIKFDQMLDFFHFINSF